VEALSEAAQRVLEAAAVAGTEPRPTSRSSSPTSSSRSTHELPCTEEVHRPSRITIFDKSHSGWSGAPRLVCNEITLGVSSSVVKEGG
jgi:hypothetical protein